MDNLSNSYSIMDTLIELGYLATSFLDWDALDNNAQKAATLLGFTKKLWDRDDYVPIYSTPFDELTDDKKEAVVYLGLRSYFA